MEIEISELTEYFNLIRKGKLLKDITEDTVRNLFYGLIDQPVMDYDSSGNGSLEYKEVSELWEDLDRITRYKLHDYVEDLIESINHEDPEYLLNSILELKSLLFLLERFTRAIIYKSDMVTNSEELPAN